MSDVIMLESDYESDDFFDEEESDFSEGEEENFAPKASSKKTTAAVKKGGGGGKKAAAVPVLASNKNAENVTSKKKESSKTIEEQYQKKSQVEHILIRPDTYIGSVERITQPMFVLNGDTDRIVQRDITFTPGLYKIFDEIVVNAADNKQRDPNMDKLEIVVDQEANSISIKNNGKGIPVAVHKEHDCYVPTLIFGHLLTGSNFDDEEKKTTGGRNGYGAKLANIFSTEFIVECVDAEKGLKFKQVFRDNMTNAEDPVVKNCTATEKKQGDYTKITFSPDLARFKMDTLDDDAVGLLSKRAYDIAGSMANSSGKRLVVTLNGKKLPVKSFQDYLKLFDGINPPDAYEKVGDRWEVGVSVSDGSFQQISFVNGISTMKGGGHVNYIADQVATSLAAAVKKKNKGGVEVKANQIKNHLCVFVNCLVENPAFDSQTKEFLTTRPKAFGSECKLSSKFLKQVEKSGVVDSILSYAKFKQGQALKRKGGVKKSKLTGIAKLDDANHAGTAKSKDCTLIITEGDSAKSLAMSGLSVVGRDYYGVFPLKGKPLNVREATHSAIMKNEEIKNLVDILGLKFGTEYDESNIKSLRYGHLMIMADQDHDGSHIKGLVINFIHRFWPTLLDVPGFLQQFITPIVKATKGKKSHTFFTIPEYEAWRESTGNGAKGYTVKYYKGLGTSTSAEAKDYFSNLDIHEVHFSKLSSDQCVLAVDNDDGKMEDAEPTPDKIVSGSDLIDMAFSKGRVEDRKSWLTSLKKETFLNYSKAQKNGVAYSDFINKELILYSAADNHRSIPNMMDGFKPSQRKVLFGCIKRKLKGEIKVAQLAGYVGEHAAYHHGEASLAGTIVGMAQNFTGSNNVNLLTPSGQFGTRLMGGKDSASARYIFTKLEKITRAIFHPDDDALLTYLEDDGMSIEPEFYVPVIPMALVNGSDGIGTGWSSSVPNYDPRQIIRNIRHLIAGEDLEEMIPFYNGFTGEIIPGTGKKQGSFQILGRIERTSDTTLVISEIPLKKSIQDFKEMLEKMMEADDKKKTPAEIIGFQQNHTDTTISFTIQATKERIDSFEKEKDGLYGKFKLTGSVATTNMNMFNEDGTMVKYDTPESILNSFYGIRMEYYEKRKELLLEKLRREQTMLSNKARFVEEVCTGELVVSNRKRADILAELQKRGYVLLEKETKAKSTNHDDDDSEDSDVEETASDADLARGYEYLLGMKIWSLTFEKAEQLRAQLAEKTEDVAELEATAPSQIWLNDLDAIEEALDERDAEMKAAHKNELKAQQKNKKRVAKKPVKKGKRKDDWDSELEDDSSDEDDFMSDSEDEYVGPKKKPVAARKKPATGATKAPAKSGPLSLAVAASQSAPKTKPAAKAATAKIKSKQEAAPPKPAAAPVDSESSDDDDDLDVTQSLMDRMKKKLVVSPPLKKAAPKSLVAARAASKSDLSSDEENEFDDLDVDQYEPASVTPARNKAKKRVSPKRARDQEDEESPKKPAAKRKTARQAKKKVEDAFEFDDFTDESDASDDGDDDMAANFPARAKSGRAQAKKVNYDEVEDSDSDFDFDDE